MAGRRANWCRWSQDTWLATTLRDCATPSRPGPAIPIRPPETPAWRLRRLMIGWAEEARLALLAQLPPGALDARRRRQVGGVARSSTALQGPDEFDEHGQPRRLADVGRVDGARQRRPDRRDGRGAARCRRGAVRPSPPLYRRRAAARPSIRRIAKVHPERAMRIVGDRLLPGRQRPWQGTAYASWPDARRWSRSGSSRSCAPSSARASRAVRGETRPVGPSARSRGAGAGYRTGMLPCWRRGWKTIRTPSPHASNAGPRPPPRTSGGTPGPSAGSRDPPCSARAAGA